MHTPSPTTDRSIACNYDARSLERKLQNKLAFQEEVNWAPESKSPLLCLPIGMSNEIGGHLFRTILPGLLSLPLGLIIRGKGSTDFGKCFSQLTKEYPHRVVIIPNNAATLSKMYAAVDMALFCSPAEETDELQICLRYGVIPVAPETPLLTTYNPNQESGHAFLYKETSPWQCFAAIVRACETYRFPFDWRVIQKQCMEAAERVRPISPEAPA